MYYTYVLFCTYNEEDAYELYTGYCEDLNQRFQDHRNHSVQTTKKFDNLELVYYEACLNKTDARKRELQLKTGFGRGYIKKRIENYIKIKRA